MARDGSSSAAVSVVIPTLGRVDRLRRALDSVRKQTILPAEIIIVDGAGNEDAKAVIEEYAFDITYIDQSGDGLSNARNLGIEASNCELIAFLDDDDQWTPEKLARQLDALESTGTAFVFTGVQHISADGERISVNRRENISDYQLILTENSVGAPSSVLVRKDCLDSVGRFDENLPSREEWDLYIRLLQEYDAVSIPDPLVIKEQHEASISRDTSSIERDWPALFEKHRSKYDESTERTFWSNYQFELGRSRAKNGTMDAARRHFFRSLRYRVVPERIGYLFAASLGKSQYDRLTEIYRLLRKVA